MVDINADHIVPEMRHILKLDASERIHHLEKDNWIGYPRAKQALAKLTNLYEHPKRQRMPNLLILGATNNGKSMIIEKFCRHYPPIMRIETSYVNYYKKEEKEVLLEMPVLSIQMPALPDMKEFFSLLLSKIRCAGGMSHRLAYGSPLESSIVNIFNEYKVKILIIDEIHNLLAGRNDKQHIFLNVLRYIGNAAKVSIVCVGTKDAYLAIRSDPQLENRFEPFVLPTWKTGNDYNSLLASILSILPLKEPSDINNRIGQYILEKTDGILGEIFTLIRRAAILAIESGKESIDDKVLKQVDYHSPSERIKLFERGIVA